jgi:CxxC motif-containing protein (DUF1111 family)
VVVLRSATTARSWIWCTRARPASSQIAHQVPKIRTAPLWGVRLRPRLMHDGASLTLRDAIQRHRGEAMHASQKFEKLKREDQEAIIEFLESL